MPIPMWSYRCEYCGGLFKSYKYCENHEASCNKNPDGKTCIRCMYGWDKKERQANNNVCYKSNKRYCKTVARTCEHFVRINYKEEFWKKYIKKEGR